MKRFTTFTILMTILVFNLWILSMDSFTIFRDAPLRAVTQISALLGATFFYLEYILSSRIKFIEQFVGALDLTYKSHRFLGMLSTILIIVHLTTLIAGASSNMTLILQYVLPSGVFSYTMGVVTFYLLMTMLLTTIYLKLPYHIWKFVHKITGFMIVSGSLHILTISSDIAAMNLLRLFFIVTITIALLIWFYKLIIYAFISHPYEYFISNIQTENKVTLITLKAREKILKFTPGQFAFFRFPKIKNILFSESHPYSIIQGDNPDEIIIGIKNLGKYTGKIRALLPGDTVKVSRAHGNFGERAFKTNNPLVLIAGGIGITPILSIMKGIKKRKSNKQIYIIHLTKDDTERPFLPLIKELTSEKVQYKLVKTNLHGRASLDDLLYPLPTLPKNYEYFVCGPIPLVNALHGYARKMDIPKEQISFEEFDFKSL